MTSSSTRSALEQLASALRRAWGPDTCAPEDRPQWSPQNPARGQCITTILVVHDAFGGELVRGDVHVDGRLVDHHWWNRLPDGREVDLTREQFAPHEIVTDGTPVPRPSDGGRVDPQYRRLRAQVDALLAASDAGS